MPRAPLRDDYVRGLMDRLERYECRDEFDGLVTLGVNKEELIRRLIGLASYRSTLEPRKPSKAVVRRHARKLRGAVRLLDDLNRHPYSNLLWGTDWRQSLQLPKLLGEYADRLETWPGSIEPRWEPVKTAAISQLVWVVKEATGRYHDSLVAPVIGALLYGGTWDTEALKQWRKRHASEIESLGPLKVLPVLARPPHKLR